MITLDFETEPADEHGRPPIPVGLAIRWANGDREYMACGHPTGNNCTLEQLTRVLQGVLDGQEELCFFNAKFDLGVIAELFRKAGRPSIFKTLDFRRVHDVIFQVFLLDPHERHIALKPSAARHLGIPPDEQKELHDWIIRHTGCAPKDAGKYICKAPADLVAKYAIGDVDRTFLLYQHLKTKVEEQDMARAYNLEREMLPYLLQAELRGIRVDLNVCEQHRENYARSLKKIEYLIFKKLGKFIELGSPQQLGKALVRGGHVTGLLPTATGKDSTGKDSIAGARWKDPVLKTAIAYWKSVTHAMSHSWDPWLASNIDGRLYSQFNQVRGSDSGLFEDEDAGGGKGLGGARTGRLSVAWFLNIANAKQKFDYSLLPPGTTVFVSPKIALLPEEGHLWLERDWKQQEFRIEAHFEYGPLFERYQENPNLEIHQETTNIINSAGYSYERDFIKTINLALLYKLGIAKLALKLHITEDEAKRLRKLVQMANPGVAQLEAAIAEAIDERGYIRTYYGARILKEPSRIIGDRMVNFIYKVPNHLIQRSAAEQMKEAVIKWHKDGYAARWPWLLSVHDANNISTPPPELKEASREMDRVMRAGSFEVQMLSDMKYGPTWGTIAKPSPETKVEYDAA